MAEIKETRKEPAEKPVIKIADVDPKFKYEISKLPGAEKLMVCFQCGTCTAGCPIARFSDSYRPRKLLRMVQLGLKKEILSSDVIWNCAGCYTCVDRCPQDVELLSIMTVIRNLAAEMGNMPGFFRDIASTLLETGYIYTIPEIRLDEREDDGLPPLPKCDVEKIKKIFDATGVSKTMEGWR